MVYSNDIVWIFKYNSTPVNTIIYDLWFDIESFALIKIIK